jgi:hypothetical protein
MILGKSCVKKYNIVNGTLRVGTLHEYRQTELVEIADREEGMLHFFLKFDGLVKVEKKWLNTIQAGGIRFGPSEPIRFPGRNKSSYKIKMEFDDEMHVYLRDSSATICRESLNSFVFCMHRVRDKRDCHDIFKGYDDYWYLSESESSDFCRAIGKLIGDKMVAEYEGPNSLMPPGVKLGGVKMLMEYRTVDYVAREVHVSGEDSLPINDYLQKMMDMTFIKPLSYQSEREFRFTYTLISPEGKIIEPAVNSVVLDSSSLLRFLI